MSKFEVVARGFVGTSMFDPHLTGQRRTFIYDAESEEDAKRIFNEGCQQQIPELMGAGCAFKLESVTKVEAGNGSRKAIKPVAPTTRRPRKRSE